MTIEAWRTAWQLFSDGYGSPPDLNDEGDRILFLGMLEREIRDSISKSLAARIQPATERIKAIDSGPLRAA